MILNLTNAEFKALESILEKVRNQQSKLLPGKALADKIREVVERFDYKFSQKIRAIKTLRQSSTWSDWRVTPEYEPNGPNKVLGLAESKCIVENFEEFIAFVEKNNAIPTQIQGGYGTPAIFR